MVDSYLAHLQIQTQRFLPPDTWSSSTLRCTDDVILKIQFLNYQKMCSPLILAQSSLLSLQANSILHGHSHPSGSCIFFIDNESYTCLLL